MVRRGELALGLLQPFRAPAVPAGATIAPVSDDMMGVLRMPSGDKMGAREERVHDPEKQAARAGIAMDPARRVLSVRQPLLGMRLKAWYVITVAALRDLDVPDGFEAKVDVDVARATFPPTRTEWIEVLTVFAALTKSHGAAQTWEDAVMEVGNALVGGRFKAADEFKDWRSALDVLDDVTRLGGVYVQNTGVVPRLLEAFFEAHDVVDLPVEESPPGVEEAGVLPEFLRGFARRAPPAAPVQAPVGRVRGGRRPVVPAGSAEVPVVCDMRMGVLEAASDTLGAVGDFLVAGWDDLDDASADADALVDCVVDVMRAGRSVFLIGIPGTGKSRLVMAVAEKLRELNSAEEVQVTATTNLASERLGETETIYSRFGVGQLELTPERSSATCSARARTRMQRVKYLLVDEVLCHMHILTNW